MFRELLIFVFAIMLVAPAVVGALAEAEAEAGTGTKETPIKRTIVFAMDSINSLSFKYAIDNGYCPNIKWLIDHGAYYENAISVLPSVSISSDFSILTGTHPGKHGILGWMWYNRSEGKYYSIDGAKIYDPVEHAKMVESKNWMSNETETMFEVLEKETGGKAYTSALGTYATKGVDYSVLESLPMSLMMRAYGTVSSSEGQEGPAQSTLSVTPSEANGENITVYTTDTNEIKSYFKLHNIKRVLFEGLIDSFIFIEMLKNVWKSRNSDNSLIYLWVAGPDTSGHLSGGRSEAMLHSYQIVDAKVGITMAFCKRLGIEDETMFVIAGNHGIKGWNDNFFERIGYRDMLQLYESILGSGLERIPGNRGIYFPNATQQELEKLSSEIIHDRFIDFVIYKNEMDEITVKGVNGTGKITIESWGKKAMDSKYTYEVIEGKDPLTDGDTLAYSPAYGLRIDEIHEEGGSPAPIPYPDAIERIIGLFYSENVPDLIITIGGESSGQHGDLSYEDSAVPLIFGGPGIKKMRTEEMISIVDIAPTIMNAMGFREPINCDGRALDILGGNIENYSLPSFFKMHIPFYMPLPIIGLSFLLQIQLIFPYMLRALLSHPTILLRIGNILEIKRIITIGELRAMLPDPPELLGTYTKEEFRTFII